MDDNQTPSKPPRMTALRQLRLPSLPVSRSVLTALIFAASIIIWVISGVISDQATSHEVAQPISTDIETAQKFKVVARIIETQDFRSTLKLQGRTEADQIVTLAAETVGIITAQDIKKGSFVQKGQVVCRIDVGARRAQLDETRALLQSRKIEYDAAKKLREKGHNSASQVAIAKAAYDGAAAAVKVREIELQRTAIAAPFAGIVDSIPVEEGDFIMVGQSCATIIDKDPILVVAFVAENQITSLHLGAKGKAHLATGESVEGKITYIAESPDATTRTFKIELETPNKDLRLRDGITADIEIDTGSVQASFIPQGILSLDAQGRIGVRVLEGGRVVFRPVTILSDDTGGAFVLGLQPQEMVITVGGEFTRSGQEVDYEMQSTKIRTQ